MIGSISEFMPIAAQGDIQAPTSPMEKTNQPGTVNALMPIATGHLMNQANQKVAENVAALGNPLRHAIQGPTASGFQARAIHGDKLRQAEDAADNIGVSGAAQQRARIAEDAGKNALAMAQKSYTDNMAAGQQAQGDMQRQVLGSMARGRSNSALAAGLSSAVPGMKPVGTEGIQAAAAGVSGAMQAGAGIRAQDFAQSQQYANEQMNVADRYKTTIDPELYGIAQTNAISGTNVGLEENLAGAIPYLGGNDGGSGSSISSGNPEQGGTPPPTTPGISSGQEIPPPTGGNIPPPTTPPTGGNIPPPTTPSTGQEIPPPVKEIPKTPGTLLPGGDPLKPPPTTPIFEDKPPGTGKTTRKNRPKKPRTGISSGQGKSLSPDKGVFTRGGTTVDMQSLGWNASGNKERDKITKKDFLSAGAAAYNNMMGR